MMQFYVSGLSLEVNEAALAGFASSVAPVGSVEIIRDLETGGSRGYGIFRVPDGAAAEAVVRLGGTVLAGNTIGVSRMPVTMPGEMDVRDWLQRHPDSVLRSIGLKNGYQVLDYGCGPGIFTIPCAQIVGGVGKVYALDVRPRALEQVKRRAEDARLKNIETILQKPSNLSTGLGAGSIDVVLIFDMMQDVEDRTGLLGEAARVLKTGGFLSVFPMHMGNAPVLDLVKAFGAFILQDKFDPPNSKSPSSILNFTRNAVMKRA